MAEEDKKPAEAAPEAKAPEVKAQEAEPESKPAAESAKPAEATAETPVKPEEAEANAEKPADSPPAESPAEEDLDVDSAKSAFLDRFKKKPATKKTSAEGSATASSNPDAVAEELYKQIVQVKGNEYIVLRFKKRTVLLILGLLVVLMWLIPLFSWGWQTWQNRQTASQAPEASEAVTPTPEAKIEAAVRIRNLRDTEEEALNVATLLKHGGVSSVEIVPDKESSFSGIGLVTKTEKADLRTELEKLLSSKYALATAAATLSSDSDFDAVVVVGTAE